MSEDERQARTEKLLALALCLAVLLAVCWIYWQGVPSGPMYYVGTVVAGVMLLASSVFAIRVDTSDTAQKVGGTVEFGPWGLVEICAVVLIGPAWASLAFIPASAYLCKLNPSRMLWDVSGGAIRLYLAAMVFGLYSAPLFEREVPLTVGMGAAVALAGMVLMSTDLVLSAISMRVRHGWSLVRSYREQIYPFMGFEVLHLLIAVCAVLLLALNNIVGACVMVVAGALATLLAYNVRNRRLENKNLKSKLVALQQRSSNEASGFARIILKRIGEDDFAARHAAATAVYASDLARQRGFGEEHASRVWLAGLLHNIGLFENSEFPYAWAEMEEDRCHPSRGAAILTGIYGYEDIAQWVLLHHERVDGSGYPNGLPRQWIKEEAQIISIAQSYAAAVLDRRGEETEPGEDPEHVQRRLLMEKEAAYEDAVIKAFSLMCNRSSRKYRLAQGERFEFPRNPLGDDGDGVHTGLLHPAQIEAVTEQGPEEPSDGDVERARLIGWPTLDSDVALQDPNSSHDEPELPGDPSGSDADGR